MTSRYRRCCSVFVVSALCGGPSATAQDARATQQSRVAQQSVPSAGMWTTQGLILERCGSVGSVTIGSRISARQRLSLARDLTVSETDGTITSIVVQTRGMFTQRYVVIGESTLFEVHQRYGSPLRITDGPKSGSLPTMEVDYPYEGIAFLFAYTPSSPGDEKAAPSAGARTALPPGVRVAPSIAAGVSITNAVKVDSVKLHPKESDPSGADHSCNVK